MIRINLLPSQYRRGQKISTKMVGVSLGSALAVCVAIGWFGLVYFGELGALEQQHAEVAAELQQKATKAAYFDKLENNRKDYLGRVQTVQEIGKSRRLWSKFIDQFIDVINNNGDTDRHFAWFDGLTIGGDARKGNTATLPGHVQGNDNSRIANLHEDIEASEFYRDIATKSDPGGRHDTNKERVPPDSFFFPLSMQFWPSIDDAKKAAVPAKPAPKPPETKK
jgi:Tfp pilus assembly protein PilN